MATSEKEQTTVQLEADGKRTEPIPIDEFHRRIGRLERQLSFDVGQKKEPDFASVKIAGSLPLSADLMKRVPLRVAITTIDGEVITEGSATVTNIAFPDKTDKHGTTTERIHTVTLD